MWWLTVFVAFLAGSCVVVVATWSLRNYLVKLRKQRVAPHRYENPDLLVRSRLLVNDHDHGSIEDRAKVFYVCGHGLVQVDMLSFRYLIQTGTPACVYAVPRACIIEGRGEWICGSAHWTFDKSGEGYPWRLKDSRGQILTIDWPEGMSQDDFFTRVLDIVTRYQSVHEYAASYIMRQSAELVGQTRSSQRSKSLKQVRELLEQASSPGGAIALFADTHEPDLLGGQKLITA